MRSEAKGLLLGLLVGSTAVAQDQGLIQRGREVYIAEGCIHCHSQYVRPDTTDVIRWGPVRSLAEIEAEKPPLIGNRRQGPDLLNVGARRTAEWQRLHLQFPRALTPGSRMPAYAHLFRPPAQGAGEALVAYLQSLGADTGPERWEAAREWRPAKAAPLSLDRVQRLYEENCASCHGAGGRGDGPLAGQLSRPPRNLTQAAWIYFSRLASGDAERLALARIIKFGLPGGNMAGREYLGDAEITALAAYVQALRAAP